MFAHASVATEQENEEIRREPGESGKNQENVREQYLSTYRFYKFKNIKLTLDKLDLLQQQKTYL